MVGCRAPARAPLPGPAATAAGLLAAVLRYFRFWFGVGLRAVLCGPVAQVVLFAGIFYFDFLLFERRKLLLSLNLCAKILKSSKDLDEKVCSLSSLAVS